jgi:hypothetical protein
MAFSFVVKKWMPLSHWVRVSVLRSPSGVTVSPTRYSKSLVYFDWSELSQTVFEFVYARFERVHV